MEESKKVYVHYEGSPEFTHVARITWGLTVEQLAVEFTRVYNAKHGRMGCLDPAMIHLLNGRRRMSKTANLIRLVKDRSDIFVEREIPSSGAGLANSSARDDVPSRVVGSLGNSTPSPKEEKKYNNSSKRQEVVSPLKTAASERDEGAYFTRLEDSALEADIAAAAKRVGQGQELQEPFICAVLVSAIKAQQLMKYKFALDIFSKVLAVLPKQPICLRGLGSITLKLRKYSDAVAWLERGVEECPKDALFRARLGDAYCGLEKYTEALKEYDLAAGLVMEQKQNPSLENEIASEDKLASSKLTSELGVPQDLLDKIDYDPRLVKDPNAGDILGGVTIDGLKMSCAAAFRKRGSGGDLDAAEHIVKSVLAQNAENQDALYEYGSLMLVDGRVQEALKAFLRLLVAKPGDKGVRSGVSKAVKRPQGMAMLKKEVALSAEAAPVLAFLASCVKDYGAIDEAIELYNLAIQLNPLSMGYFLSLIHLHEVMYEYLRAVGLAVSMFRTFPSFSLSSLQFSDVLPYFEGPNWTESPDNISQQCQNRGVKFLARAEFFRWFDDLPIRAYSDSDSSSECSGGEEMKKRREGNCTYNGQELDSLAVLFTVTKILFLGGALDRAKQLARLIEPAKLASVQPLHQTIIRNEAAYFSSVLQILEQYPIPLPLPPLKEQEPLFLAGDSHCLSAAWRTARLRGKNRLLVPLLVTGLKVWHLRPDSEFYPKHAFQNVMQSLANGAQLVMVYGEIDCRESILAAVEKGVYKNVEHGVEEIVNIYLEVLQHLVFSREFELFVHPVPPVLNETRAVVLVFNKVLKGRLEALKEKSAVGKRLHWLDFAPDLLNGEGLLREQYKLDGTHLSPKYSTLLQRELRKVK